MFSEESISAALEYSVSVLKRLISINTVSPQGEGYEEASELLARELEGLGFKVDVIRVPKKYQEERCRLASDRPRFIVFGRWGGPGKRLHFNGHYDVVPGGSGWSVTDPFEPVVVGEKLYGRGAVDMKGGIAAALGAFKLLRDSGFSPAGTIEAAFVPDEEIGGACGTGYLVESMEAAPDYVVLPEPSSLETPWLGHRGILWVKVKVKGRNAHAMIPWLGRNAFLQAAQLALELQDTIAAAYSGRTSKYRIDPPEASKPTAMIGGIAGIPGGGKTNQVPGEFVFTVDRRLIPEESVDSAESELRSMISWIAYRLGIEYEVDREYSAEPAINDPGELYEALKNAAEETGVKMREALVCPGGLDMWYYTKKGSKAIAYGPSYKLAHAPDESIELGELKALIEVYARLTKTIAGP